MTDPLTIHVNGTPAPQGSHRGFVVNGRAVVTSDNKKTRPWRQDVTAAALDTMANTPGFEPFTGPVMVDVLFAMPRPRYHFGTGRNANQLKPNAPVYVDKKPDSDKLLRSILDALTASGVFRDDAQVADIHGAKVYANGPAGAHITITPLDSGAAALPTPEQPAATVQEALL